MRVTVLCQMDKGTHGILGDFVIRGIKTGEVVGVPGYCSTTYGRSPDRWCVGVLTPPTDPGASSLEFVLFVPVFTL